MTGTAVAEPPTSLKSVKDEQSIGQMPDPPESQEEPEGTGQIAIDGTVELGKLKAGGKPATHSTLKFEGLKEVTLADRMAFEKGNVVYITGVATVIEAGQRDKRDTVTKQVVDCKQKHVAVIDEFRVVSEPVVPISSVQVALSEIAELAALGGADIPGAIEAAIDKLASFS